jgi:hypothetical protein
MATLYARLQEIIGEKIFRHKVTFDGDVVFKKHITAYAPVPGEPSLGTPHPTSDANRPGALIVDTSTNTAGTWSAAVTMTGVPAGAKAAWCFCSITKAAGQPSLCVEAATGYTLSDITTTANIYKYWSITPQAAGATAFGMIKVHLDANRQFKWCTNVSSSTVQIGSAIDYEM